MQLPKCKSSIWRNIEKPISNNQTYAIHCQEQGCNTPTKGGKDRCLLHIEERPYVRKLLGKLADIEREVLATSILGAKAVRENSDTLMEIISLLEAKGAKTVKGISKELKLDVVAVEGYIDYLQQRGKVFQNTTKRKNGSFVHLTRKSATCPL